MLLVKPSHEILTEIDGERILKNIERAGRTCYKSEDKITEDSAKKFVKMVAKRGHHSVIEHENISVKFICDRGVTHEIVRHRLAAYSQECITGDTKVTKLYTIKDLYDRQESGSSYDKTHNKTINLKSVNEHGLIIPNKIKKVFYKGKQKVYEVKTKLGYSIKSTLSHRYKNKDEIYDFLENFVVGDLLFVNGRPSLVKVDDWYIGKKEILDEIISIKYIGEEDTYDIEMHEPYHNYVANGFIVHNSTRYCNYSGGVTYIIPPWINIKEGKYEPKEYWPDEISDDMPSWLWFKAMLDAEHVYTTLLREGWSPQQARSTLPNSLKTEIVMTANIREWRHVFTLRCSKASHPQMNELMIPLLSTLKEKVPILFDDINQ